MFTYNYLGRHGCVSINDRQGIKTSQYARLEFEGFGSSEPAEQFAKHAMFDVLQRHNPEHQKIKRVMVEQSNSSEEIRNLADQFSTLLCHALNHPAEPVKERPDTRYSYEENKTGVAHFRNPETGKTLGDAFAFRVKRYTGAVDDTQFTTVYVWSSNADCGLASI